MANPSKFTSEELLTRASERVAWVMRHMHEEKGSSHSRLLDDMLMPNDLIVVGRSKACVGNGYREHVVPCAMIIKRGHRMIDAGATDAELAAFIRKYTKIVRIAPKEAEYLNRKHLLGLKDRMPGDWDFRDEDDLYARLTVAGIEWVPTTAEVAR